MIDSITCDTPIDCLINQSDVEGFLSDYKEIFTSYQTNLNDTLSKEISSGGLAADKALIIDNESPVNIKAQDIMKLISDTTNITEFCNNVKDACSEQRRLEIEKLKAQIIEKISELNMELLTYNQKK